MIQQFILLVLFLSMGFGFSLFGLPLLLIVTVALLLFATRKKSALKVLAAIWLITIVLVIACAVASHLREPILLTKQDVVGEYRIDTTFYPGKNARWQYYRYKFRITNSDSLYFTIMDTGQHPYKIFAHKINQDFGPPFLWSVVADSTCHIIRAKPILHRGHNKFYYVLHSDKFGNMFFRHAKAQD